MSSSSVVVQRDSATSKTASGVGLAVYLGIRMESSAAVGSSSRYPLVVMKVKKRLMDTWADFRVAGAQSGHDSHSRIASPVIVRGSESGWARASCWTQRRRELMVDSARAPARSHSANRLM